MRVVKRRIVMLAWLARWAPGAALVSRFVLRDRSLAMRGRWVLRKTDR
jgi:hypothetical protein